MTNLLATAAGGKATPAAIPPGHPTELPVGIEAHLCYLIDLHWLSAYDNGYSGTPDMIPPGGRPLRLEKTRHHGEQPS